jgi:hypothetical protein
MALLLNQYAITTSATLVETVPPNSTVTMTVPTGDAPVYVGTSVNVTASNGFIINPGVTQVNFFLPPTSQPASIYAIGTTSTVLCFAITSTA